MISRQKNNIRVNILRRSDTSEKIVLLFLVTYSNRKKFDLGLDCAYFYTNPGYHLI